jgi:pSer/pThr/pTyr-binding forkhead associated (FHA) protein/regulator of replication initiation timing
MGDSENAARKLVVLSGKAKGTSFVLTEPEVKAGREKDNGICLKGKRVSRYHAVLLRTNGEYTLRDLSPRVGTLLNGRRRREAALKLGDQIRIGEFELRYEAAVESPTPSPSAAAPPRTDEFAALRLELAAAKEEANEARALAERTAAEFVCARVEAEKSASEYQQRIAELMQENERCAGEINRANETLKSLHARPQTQSDPEVPVLKKQLDALTQQNAALAEQNTHLQAKISELEESVRKADHRETELASKQAALNQTRERPARNDKSTKLDAIAEELSRALQSAPAERAAELEEFQAVLAEIRDEWRGISELHIQVERLMQENHNLRIAATKAQEEATHAKRCLSEQTSKEFDQIRRAIVAKQSEKPDGVRFWPFRATPHTSQTL